LSVEDVSKLVHWIIEECMSSDVLGWASSPEPAKPSPFKPKLSRALTRACSGLGLGFRFQKPEPEAQARALIHCGLVCKYMIKKVISKP
jgi:hypothetical protein